MFSATVTITDFSVTSLPNLNSVGVISCTVHGTNATDTLLAVTGDRTNVTLINSIIEPTNRTLTKIYEVTPTQKESPFQCTAHLANTTVSKSLILHAFGKSRTCF